MHKIEKHTVLLIRIGAYDITPAIPRFVGVLLRLEERPKVTVLCWPYDRKAEAKGTDPTEVEVLRYTAQKKHGFVVLGVLGWWLRIMKEAFLKKYTVVQSSDLVSSLPCLLAKVFVKFHFIFDIRDPIAAITTNQRTLKTRFWGRIEAFVASQAECVIVADDNRQRFLPKAVVSAGKHLVIRNLPEVEVHAYSDEITDFAVIQITFAGYLSKMRGSQMLLNCLKVYDRMEVQILGHSTDSNLLAAFAELPNSLLRGRVPHMEALRLMGHSHLVSLLYDPAFAINQHAAPNKFYEALMLGVPVLTCFGTPMAEVVEKYDCGYVVNYGDEESLLKVIETIRNNPESWRAKAKRARQVYEKNYRWNPEAAKLSAVYASLLNGK